MKRTSISKKNMRYSFFFLIPWLFGTVMFFLIPLVKAVYYSFCTIRLEVKGMSLDFKGVETYRRILFDDPDNIRLIFGSVRDMFLHVLIVIVFSILLAIILNQKFRGRLLARAVFALPIIISSGVTILILKSDGLNQSMNESADSIFQAGRLVTVLVEMGLPAQIVTFFTSVVAGIFDLVWKSGMQIILFLATLSTIPKTSYEAVQIEGATAWETFWFITFPMISPMLLVNVIYTVIDTFTDAADPVMSKVFAYLSDAQYETGLSLGMIYFSVVFVITVIVYAVLSKRLSR